MVGVGKEILFFSQGGWGKGSSIKPIRLLKPTKMTLNSTICKPEGGKFLFLVRTSDICLKQVISKLNIYYEQLQFNLKKL